MSVLMVVMLASRNVLTHKGPTPVNVCAVMSLGETNVHAEVN